MSGASEGFVHLRTRSAYSLLEGAIKAERLGPLARERGMPAVALTDRTNLFGALEFSVDTQGAGVQPIIGCALPVSGLGEGPHLGHIKCRLIDAGGRKRAEVRARLGAQRIRRGRHVSGGLLLGC